MYTFKWLNFWYFLYNVNTIFKGLSEEIRKRIIGAFLNDRHPDKIARLIGCHRTTVDRVIKKYNSAVTTTPKKRDGYKPKMLSAIHQEAIQSYINANCSITLDQCFPNFS